MSKLTPSKTSISTKVGGSLRGALPAILIVSGLAQLLIFHAFILGFSLMFLGGFGILLRHLKRRIETIEAETIPNNWILKDSHKDLKRLLTQLQGVDGCEKLAVQAEEQFQQAHKRMETFHRLLRSKLGPSELTFSRYFTAAEQVFLALIDRLKYVSELLVSIEGIRPTDVREKLRANPADEDIFRNRLEIARKQTEKAEDLLKVNEMALTQMDLANAGLTEMRTEPDLAMIELPEALKQLEELASRAKFYSIKN